MKRETYYKNSGRHILKGVCQLCVSIVHTIENYPAWFILTISITINIWLFVGLANARAERDHYNQQAYDEQVKIDSLSILLPHWHH